MIKFKKENNKLILSYSAYSNVGWIIDQFNNDSTITLLKTYTLEKDNLYFDNDEEADLWEESDDYLEFSIAELEKGYYHFNKKIFNIEFELFISEEVTFSEKLFRAERNIPILKKIDNVLKEDLIIGSDEKSNLPIEEYLKLVQNFPNSYELTKYSNFRVTTIINDYFEEIIDAKDDYEKYMNKKTSKKGKDLYKTFQKYEIEKYEAILYKLENMLTTQEAYTEKQWQREINQIVLLLYPKYFSVFEEVPIKDYQKNTTRFIDFMLVDTNGNIDIIEIKRPFNNSVLMKRPYRDNYVPKKELSGSIMQIEKYIYHLNKWGIKGEMILTEKYKNNLPINLEISISNPSGIIIMGRDNDLDKAQQQDFELIKRKYRNIIDIITYDDLIRRLKSLIMKFKI